MEATVPNHAGVISTATRSWGGLPFVSVDERNGYVQDFAFPEYSLWFADRGSYKVRWREGKRECSARYAQGSAAFWNRGHGISDCEGQGTISALSLYFPEQHIETLLHEETTRAISGLSAGPFRMHGDIFIATLMRQISTEIRDACPSGTVFAESVSMSLLAYLLGNMHRQTALNTFARPLGGAAIQKLRSHIADHIAEDLSLVQMSALVGMSPRQLSRTFRLATGESVHQYVIRLRVERAKGMLWHRSVTDVAMDLGFASSSHFSNTFRKVVGCSPAHFKRQL